MSDKKPFWPYAKQTNTSRRYDPGTTKYRHKIDLIFGKGAFRGLRRFEGPGREKRITIEIDNKFLEIQI